MPVPLTGPADWHDGPWFALVVGIIALGSLAANVWQAFGRQREDRYARRLMAEVRYWYRESQGGRPAVEAESEKPDAYAEEFSKSHKISSRLPPPLPEPEPKDWSDSLLLTHVVPAEDEPSALESKKTRIWKRPKV